MENHGSDADDESTDVSGEYHNSSNELRFIPHEYSISSGSKPLSLVIRRCSTPTTENSFSSVRKRYSSVSSPLTKESERTSNSEVLNLEREVNDSHFQKEVRIACNAVNSNLEEFDNCLVPTISGIGVRGLQEVILSSSQESSRSVVTHEYIENVINGNDLSAEICSSHNVEGGLNFYYTDDSTLLQSKPVFENCCSDNVYEQFSVSPVCSRDTCERVESATIDNKNQHSPHPLENSESTQSLIHTPPTQHCKQKGELFAHRLFEEVPGRNIVDSTVRIIENEGCQEMNAVGTTKYESNIPATLMLDNDSFHMSKYSESAENMNDLQAQSETYAVGGELVVESTVIESPVHEIHEAEGIPIVSDSLKFQSSESALLQIKGGNTIELDNQTERGNEVSTIVSNNTEVSVGRNLFDEEDHIACTEKSGEIESSEVSSDGSGTTLKYDTIKSEKQIEIVHEPLMLQKINCNLEEIKVNTPQDASVVNVMRNAIEVVSPASVGCAQSFSQFENSENSCPVIETENRQTLSAEDDILVQKHVQCSFDNERELRTESGFCCSPKDPLPSIGLNAIQISGETAKEQPVNIKTVNDAKAEVTKNSVCSSVLVGESENTVAVASTDCHRDQFFKTSKIDVSQSHNSSVLVQSYIEDTLDCSNNDVSSDAVYVEHSPLLFSSDDEKSYYTEAVSNEQETSATTSNYNEIMTAEQKRLHRLQVALQGVPPPPSVTIPQLDVTDILRLLKENRRLMISADAENEDSAEAVESQKAPLKPSFVEQMKNASWPESKYYCYYGIHYNHGQISEEFEILCQKLRERYVGCETTSSCSIWFNCDISKKMSNITSRRRSSGQSPGRRLSHLARRRQTFSSANLLNNSLAGQVSGSRHSAALERRLFMVEIKKSEHRQRSKNNHPHRQVPSADCSRLQQTKRALFKSPPSNHQRMCSSSKSRSGSKKNKSDIDRTRVQNSKRALWPSTSKDNATVKAGDDRALTNLSGQINVYGKRTREESGKPAQHKKCPRRMLFGDAAVKGKSDFMIAGDKSQRVRTGENKPQVSSVSRDLTGGLSEAHRKKLLWAVAEALRTEGISMSHPLFRPSAASLARLVLNVMPDLKCKRSGSTSDIMLQLAKEHIKDVIKEQQNGESKVNSSV